MGQYDPKNASILIFFAKCRFIRLSSPKIHFSLLRKLKWILQISFEWLELSEPLVLMILKIYNTMKRGPPTTPARSLKIHFSLLQKLKWILQYSDQWSKKMSCWLSQYSWRPFPWCFVVSQNPSVHHKWNPHIFLMRWKNELSSREKWTDSNFVKKTPKIFFRGF